MKLLYALQWRIAIKITRSFTLEELTHTNTGLPNAPSAEDAARLADLASTILQPIRDHWGGIWVTSGYRGKAVNEKVGGSPTSQHCKGEAADLKPLEANIDSVFRWLVKESRIPYGQAILEKVGDKEWIHVSLTRKDKPNHQSLVYNGKEYRPYAG